MNISENEVHSAIYCSENEYFARRCRHYKAKESKAESLDLKHYILHTKGDDLRLLIANAAVALLGVNAQSKYALLHFLL